jgi:hypothetical protein
MGIAEKGRGFLSRAIPDVDGHRVFSGFVTFGWPEIGVILA